MITVTFIRHGESTDNLKSVWAGWKDSPLSNHGMNQARALGAFFADTSLTYIYASDLKRAALTAGAVHDSQPSPKPPLTHHQNLREQHWGEAEGFEWSYQRVTPAERLELKKKGVYPVNYDRQAKFEGGESAEDAARRAEGALREFVVPEVIKAAKEGREGIHVAIVSHGLFISELIAALLRWDPSKKGDTNDYRGLMNTAWGRAEVGLQASVDFASLRDDELPPLNVRVTHFNQHSHTDSVKRQSGGIGSTAFDPKQKDIRAFFGGAAVDSTDTLDNSQSNARDEVGITLQSK